MNDWSLIYIRLASYFFIIITSFVTYKKHCKSRILLGSIFMALTLMIMLFNGRIFNTFKVHSGNDIILNIGVIIWASFHLADFIKDGQLRK